MFDACLFIYVWQVVSRHVLACLYWHVYAQCLINVYLYMFDRCSPDMSTAPEIVSAEQKKVLRVSMFWNVMVGITRSKVIFTTVLVQIASALIILQMLTFQSDSLVSMKEMGRYSWFQHCTSVGHCAVPSSTALVWPLGMCLEWVVDMFTEKHSSTLTLLILSSRQAT